MNLPVDFENRMKALLGEEYEAFAKAFCEGSEAKGLRFSLSRFPGGEAALEAIQNRFSTKKEKGGIAEKEIQIPEGDFFGAEALADCLSGPVLWNRAGFYLRAEDSAQEESDSIRVSSAIRPGKSIYHEAGAYYLQEPSAMVVAALADVKPGEKVLDLCAAPGGKSTALGDALNGEGILVSNEIHPARVKILSENIERMGISNALVLNETPVKIAELFPELFDCVVVDAPCSGEGMFRKEEAALTEWSEENVEMCAARQREILKEAVKCVAPGGRLVYSTCTFAPSEDEENVLWLLSEYPEFRIAEIPAEIRTAVSEGRPEWVLKAGEMPETKTGIMKSPDNKTVNPEIVENCVRIWPHLQKGEGHFAAVFEKNAISLSDTEISANESSDEFTGESKGETAPGEKKKSSKNDKFEKHGRSGRGKNIALSREQRESFDAFEKETLTEEGRKHFKEVSTYSPDDERVAALFGDNLYIMPLYFPGKGVKIERAGLHVGTFAKNRFEPSLALSRVLKKEDVRNVLSLTEAEKDKALAYLRGEQINGIPADLKGWTLVMYEGYGLGFGKATGGVLKNHYPKGLRKNL